MEDKKNGLPGDTIASLLLDAAYLLGLAAASPFLGYKMLREERYRAGLWERLGRVAPRLSSTQCLWIHAASVGEVQACRSLVPAAADAFPGVELILSTQTQTGAETASKLFPGCRHIYFPLDLTPVVNLAISRIRPSCVVLVEREIWPHFIRAADRRSIPVIQVNGTITESSLRKYKWIHPFIGPALRRIRCYAVQTEEYAERLKGLGIPGDRVQVTGNLKYDSIDVTIPGAEKARIQEETGLRDDAAVLVCGSIHPSEEKVIVKAFQQLKAAVGGARLVLVPRHIERIPEIERSVTALGEIVVRKTGLKEGERLDDRVLIVDTIGELRAIYSLATVVFVGGTLVPVGGHNLLEPAALGKPVLMGHHVFKQAMDAELLLEGGGARICSDTDSLAKSLIDLFNDSTLRESMGLRAQSVILSNQGATQRTIDLIRPYLLKGNSQP